jgi:hypothetical protein
LTAKTARKRQSRGYIDARVDQAHLSLAAGHGCPAFVLGVA